MATAPPIPVIVLAGATGTGKSALALALAKALDGTIVNADSRQVYKDFPRITAQPTPADQALVPHELYGFLPCREKLSAGTYAALAAKSISAAHAAGRLPILTGGTGLYLQTLLSGIAPIPPIPPAISRHWQELCTAQGPNHLHEVLRQRDPDSAARLHPNDSQRLIRALEVLDGTGRPLGYWHALPLPPSPYRALFLYADLSLAAITPHLNARIQAMLAAGALEEARAAYRLCPDPASPGWSGIGCAELFRFLRNETDLPSCIAAWEHNTRAYAKRQITWFTRRPGIVPCNPADDAAVLALAREFLARAA